MDRFFKESKCALWQILPLGPTGYGDSPYQCFSAFAGNPFLISPTLLYQDGLLKKEDLADRPDFPRHQVDYGAVIPWKQKLLARAYARFHSSSKKQLQAFFAEFQEDNAEWLNDFALFMAIKGSRSGAPWSEWPVLLRSRNPQALENFINRYEDKIRQIKFSQFLFDTQWKSVLAYAKNLGITIIGDIPLFIAYDSSDAWSNPQLFTLLSNGKPKLVAGVPPDYFSPTGQLWGNPQYRWDIHKQDNYAWWINRIRSTLSQVDIIRLDHFRGFSAYWEVDGNKKTAETGRWVRGPGIDFFNTLKKELGQLPLIAEDLGLITPDVIDLRTRFDLPGMKICQFAFAGKSDDPFLPHNYPVNCVAYTGTHDNDTVKGWYQTAPEKERDAYRRYAARDGSDVGWDLIRMVWASSAKMTLAPLQDFLRLGMEARMNYPGRPFGNWTWRYQSMDLDDYLIYQIQQMNELYGRVPDLEKMVFGIPKGYPIDPSV